MARKRNYIKEILNKDWRMHRRGTRWDKFTRRLTPLLHAREALLESDISIKRKQELFRYFPIAQIAAMEGYFRLVYKQLIDYGEPYLSNAVAFKDMKFEIEELLAIQGKVITSGQIISHLLPHKSIHDINKNMSTILGKDFFEELKRVNVPEFTTDIPIEKAFPAFINATQYTFELRHLFCHELGTKIRPSIKEMNEAFTLSGWLVIFTEHYLENLLPEQKKNR